MSTNTDNRNYDRDQRQPDRDQTENQSYSSSSSSRDEQRGGRSSEGQKGDGNSSSTRDLEMRWQEIETDYRRRYPDLSDDDLNYRDGQFNDMTDRIAQQTNRNRQEVEDEIWEWDSDLSDSEDAYDIE